MSRGWEREDWRLDEARSRRLPSVEDLPETEGGYDRAAVEAAFESFYRHAAEVDRTLDVLESVAAFQREAGALRADIRALRAASWGPVPTLRHTVATTAVGRVDRGRGPLEAWPRLALYSAFIIFVAVGSAVADLSSGAIVALVLASWLVVGVAELAVSGLGGRVGRAPRGYPGWAEPEPVAAAAPAGGAAAPAEPVVEVEEAAEEEAEPEQPASWRPWTRPDEPAAEAEPAPEPELVAEEPEAEVEPERVAEEPELEPEPAVQPEPVAEEPEREPEPEPEPAAQFEPLAEEPEREPEVEPVAEVEQPEFVPAPEPFGQPPDAPLRPVEIVPELEPFDEAEPEPETHEEPGPIEAADAEPLHEPEPAAEAPVDPEAAEPRSGRRLRFWRRRPVEEPAALEPLPEPRHVRLVEVEVDEEPQAEEVPVEVAEPAAEADELSERERWPELEPEVEEAEPEPSAAEAAPEPEEMQAEPEPEQPENLEDTDERPAFAAPPSSLRLRRGRR